MSDIVDLQNKLADKDAELTRLQEKVAQLEAHNTELFDELKKMSARYHRVALEHAKQFDECERLRQQHEWQPIETAPTDGTYVLVASRRNLFETIWDVSEARFIDGEGWWATNNDPSDSWGGQLYPTIWTPEPEPQQLAKEQP